MTYWNYSLTLTLMSRYYRDSLGCHASTYIRRTSEHLFGDNIVTFATFVSRHFSTPSFQPAVSLGLLDLFSCYLWLWIFLECWITFTSLLLALLSLSCHKIICIWNKTLHIGFPTTNNRQLIGLLFFGVVNVEVKNVPSLLFYALWPKLTNNFDFCYILTEPWNSMSAYV